MMPDALLLRLAFGLVGVLWTLLLAVTTYFLNETQKQMKELNQRVSAHDVAFAEVRGDIKHINDSDRRQGERRQP